MSFINYVGDPKNGKVLKRTLYVILAVVVVADFLVPRHHPVFWWDEIPGFWALFGFVSCVLLIIIPKAVGYVWLMKKEDYYD